MSNYENFDNVYFMDLGKNKVTLLNRESKDVYSLAATELFDFMLSQPEGTLWIGEAAHFGTPQNADERKLSKAQYWKENELLQLYEELNEAGHYLKLFPQKSTSKYRVRYWDKLINFAKDKMGVDIKEKKISKEFNDLPGKSQPKKSLQIDRDDLVDCMVMWFIIEYKPEIFDSIKNPVNTFHNPRREEGLTMKEEMNGDKRFIKQFDYQHPKDKVSAYLCDIIPTLYFHFNPVQRDMFNLPVQGKINGTLNSYNSDGLLLDSYKEKSLSMLTSLCLTMMTSDGQLRIRPSTGEVSGWKFTKEHLLKLHAYHMKGGVCRADIMYNRFPQWIAGKMDNKLRNANGKIVKKQIKDYTVEEDKMWNEYRNIFTKNIHSAFNILKGIILGETKTITIDELNEILREEHRIAKQKANNQQTIEFSS